MVVACHFDSELWWRLAGLEVDSQIQLQGNGLMVKGCGEKR